MEKYTADGAWSSTQIPHPIISPRVLQGFDGPFVKNVIMARSTIVVISKIPPFGLAQPSIVEI